MGLVTPGADQPRRHTAWQVRVWYIAFVVVPLLTPAALLGLQAASPAGLTGALAAPDLVTASACLAVALVGCAAGGRAFRADETSGLRSARHWRFGSRLLVGAAVAAGAAVGLALLLLGVLLNAMNEAL